MILAWIRIIVLIDWVVMKIAWNSGNESKSDALEKVEELYAKG